MTRLLTYIIICIIHFFALIIGKRGQGLKFNIQKNLIQIIILQRMY